MKIRKTVALISFFFCLVILFCSSAKSETASETITIGLDADMSSGSANSGEAIRRGAVLAIDEINTQGGVLGKKLRLLIRDHRGNPARGIDNLLAYSEVENLVAVIGGLHTPVAMAELKTIHEHNIIYLSPWAAGTPIIKNGFKPNYAFRISVRDEYAGGFLINEVLKRGYQRPALLLEQTGWGRSNQKSMIQALKKHNIEAATIQWFTWGTQDVSNQIKQAKLAEADVILLVANAPEGVITIKSMAAFSKKKRLPIFSHWGITGGNFFKNSGNDLNNVELYFLQTYSFLDPKFPIRSKRVVKHYQKLFPKTKSSKDIFSPVGTAHTIDLIHLLKRAIEKAGSSNRPAVREALEQLGRYDGLVRNYDPAFSKVKHDALDSTDFRLARFDHHGVIVPVNNP